MVQFTNSIPTYDAMLIPTVQALQQLGGSGTISEIYNAVIQRLDLPDSLLDIPHGNTSQSEIEYRLGWSRTYLKKYGLLTNSARGVWALTATSIDIDALDARLIVKTVRDSMAKASQTSDAIADEDDTSPEPDASPDWQQQLHQALLSLDPSAFERLVQRLLRESGFIQVQVTGKSGDGGIDGIGIARLNGFLSFHILFQCKRYQGSVTASQVRDFRGAMQGRTDKGLLITTGTFTRDAMAEATRDGAPPIDLIDGEELVNRLKELGLGVTVQLVESVQVDTEWFSRL